MKVPFSLVCTFTLNLLLVPIEAHTTRRVHPLLHVRHFQRPVRLYHLGVRHPKWETQPPPSPRPPPKNHSATALEKESRKAKVP